MTAEELYREIMLYGAETIVKDGEELVKDSYTDYSAKMLVACGLKKLEQGCEMYLQGERHPMRGVFTPYRTTPVHQFKRAIPTIIRATKWKIIAALYVNKNWSELVDFIYYGMQNAFYQNPKYYSVPVYEVYKNIGNDKIRDILCAILQFDPAYRYRFQDIICEINKEEFEKHPLKEFRRLWLITQRRERKGNSLLETKKIRFWYFAALFILKPKLLKEIKKFVKNIDLQNLQLNIQDWYWCCLNYPTYNFRDVGFEDRLKQYEEMKNEKA